MSDQKLTVPSPGTLSFTLKLPFMPVGFCLESVGSGQTGKVLQRAFLTSDDGTNIYDYLDQLCGMFLAPCLSTVCLPLECVNCCLVNVLNGTDAAIWVNPTIAVGGIIKRAVEAGEAVFSDDLADVRDVSFENAPMPERGAVIYMLRWGWRNGLYFDFTMHPHDLQRPLEGLSEHLGQLHNLHLRRERFRIPPDIIERLYAQGWFPFARLRAETIRSLCKAYENGNPTSAALLDIMSVIDNDSVAKWPDAWSRRSAFQPHIDMLRHGVDRFVAGDYASSVHLIAPRIEGILRHLHLGKGTNPRSPQLVKNLVDAFRSKVSGATALLPEGFHDYLRKFYYAQFDLDTGKVEFSRNSLAHGVTPSAEFDRLRALQLILTVDQIAFFV